MRLLSLALTHSLKSADSTTRSANSGATCLSVKTVRPAPYYHRLLSLALTHSLKSADSTTRSVNLGATCLSVKTVRPAPLYSAKHSWTSLSRLQRRPIKLDEFHPCRQRRSRLFYGLRKCTANPPSRQRALPLTSTSGACGSKPPISSVASAERCLPLIGRQREPGRGMLASDWSTAIWSARHDLAHSSRPPSHNPMIMIIMSLRASCVHAMV